MADDGRGGSPSAARGSGRWSGPSPRRWREPGGGEAAGLDRRDFVSFSDNDKFRADDRLAVVTPADAEVQGRCLEAAEAFWAEVQAARRAAAGQAV